MVTAQSAPSRADTGSVAGSDIAKHLHEYKTRGYTVFERLLPPDLTEDLRREHVALIEAKVARSRIPLRDLLVEYTETRREGGNHDYNRWNMHLPSRYPFLDPRVIAHPVVHELLEQIFGEELILGALVSENAFPKAANQRPHQDEHTPTVSVNILLVDVDASNAPTQVWPGTHIPADILNRGEYSLDSHTLFPDDIDRARSNVPHVYLTYPAGTVIVRDHRMLHRGTIHRGNALRPMLTLLHRVAPPVVAHRSVGNRVAAFLRRHRHAIWETGEGEVDYGTLDVLAVAGAVTEILMGTDRDATRPIPASLWASLPPRAKRLLRYAQVEGDANPCDKQSWRRTAMLLAAVPGALTFAAALSRVDGAVKPLLSRHLQSAILEDWAAGIRRASTRRPSR